MQQKVYKKVHKKEILDKALNNNEFSGFTVATPAETHYEIAKKIIEAKTHMLVEKPISLTIEDAEAAEAVGQIREALARPGVLDGVVRADQDNISFGALYELASTLGTQHTRVDEALALYLPSADQRQ